MNSESSNKCCVCFATDAGYLFPALVSAIQARAHSSASLADVAIYFFPAEPCAEEKIARICDLENIRFFTLNRDVIEQAEPTYARFYLDRFAAPQYNQFLYIDSDTQIVGSLDPLIQASIQPGHFLAAPDAMAFLTDEVARKSKWRRGYLESIQCSNSADYFNGGVLRINRSGWTELASKAHLYCRSMPPQFARFWDQDGLNAVAGSARLPMSLKWNFPIYLRNGRVEREIQPTIYHFSSNPKPWNGNFPPWSQTATQPYANLIKKYPELSRYLPPFSLKRRMKYILQQRLKQCQQTVTWGFSARRNRILEYESLSAIRNLPAESNTQAARLAATEISRR